MYQKHHIIPRHEWKARFGNLVGFNAADNVVYLTAEQHAECHKWLWEQYHRKGDWVAWQMLSGQMGKEELILERQRMGGKKGVPRTEEAKRNMRGKLHGPMTQEQKKRISQSLTGFKRPKRTQEHINNQASSQSKIWRIILPNKTTMVIQNLQKFCREHKLNSGAMCQVAKGAVSHHKQYICERVVS